MLKWIAVYEGGHRNPITTEKANLEPSALREFDDAKDQGTFEGHRIIGMWLIDEAAEPADVIRICGSVPRGIIQRHKLYQERTRGRHES
ncbi:MAG TPA: hypothetical protein VGZ72_12270 [Stellaceae bacterium]|jgi:hypothetical protein|nr:hypothetical protein [Stellaceae bacterium]